jgi:protein SCO1/2
VRRVLAALAVGVVAVLAGCSPSGHPAASSSSQLNDNAGTGRFLGAELTPALPRPSFALTDASGQPFSFAQQTVGHPTLLYFGYTNCPDVCPETMADVALALKSLPLAVQKITDVVFVTTDVRRDTGAVLTKWLANFTVSNQAHWVGLRGSQAEIDAAQTAARVSVAEDDGQTHSAQVLLYGADNYARVTFLQSTNEQQQIAHDLPLVAGA